MQNKKHRKFHHGGSQKKRKPSIPSNMPVIEIEIQNLSHDGRGIGRLEGKTVFVEGALPNETVKAKIIKQQKRFDEALLVETLQKSADRIDPLCEYFEKCGGCVLQHLQTEKQIEFKQQYLMDTLQRIAGVSVAQILPPLVGPQWNYRRKARLATSYDKKAKHLQIGFREKNSTNIIEIKHCEVMEAPFNQNIAQLSELINTLEKALVVSHIELAKADNANAIVLRHVKSLPDTDLNKLMEFGKANNIHVYLQGNEPQDLRCLFPENHELLFKVNEPAIEYVFSPTDFVQVNSTINSQMISRALTLLQPSEDDIVLDLFSGIGNFALPISKSVRKVVGVEGDIGLVQRARINAQRNHCENAEFFCSDLTKDITDMQWVRENVFNKIILDPPRSGAIELMPLLGKIKPQKIVYISCDAATLARDIAVLAEKYKYKVKQAGVMDMFPHTAHVESIVLLERK